MLGNAAYLWVAALAASSTSALAQSTPDNSTTDGTIPQVQLDQGTFNGVRNGSVDKFLGIQYAKPTWADARLRLPVANDPYTGEHNATDFGFACLQPDISPAIPDGLDPQATALLQSSAWEISTASDDCLYINVVKPSNITANTTVPVVVWIYGGGFEIGSSTVYDGSTLVQTSIDLEEPVIYVSFNYRVNAYGFLNGAEVEAAGVANLGLQDQRQALRWVQKYISAFGGDNSKVTIWGQSAGAISAAHQLIANGGDTEGLFHGAFLQSGSILPYGDTRKGQRWYDSLVQQSGCGSSNDTLVCIRSTLPAEVIDAIVLHAPSVWSPESLNLTWAPRADGKFVQDIPYQSVLKGKIANVPIIVGDVDDEATLFTVSLTNITTEDEVRAYISSNYFPNATAAEVDHLLKLYPANVTLGSPFGTGDANAVTPQFKRLAALQGDLLFHAPRRFLLQNRADRQPMWSYVSKRSKSFPDFGSYHGSDLDIIYDGGDLALHLINFVSHQNPNGKGNESWTQYTHHNPTLLTLVEGSTPTTLNPDNFRTEAINYLNLLLLKYPL